MDLQRDWLHLITLLPRVFLDVFLSKGQNSVWILHTPVMQEALLHRAHLLPLSDHV